MKHKLLFSNCLPVLKKIRPTIIQSILKTHRTSALPQQCPTISNRMIGKEFHRSSVKVNKWITQKNFTTFKETKHFVAPSIGTVKPLC